MRLDHLLSKETSSTESSACNILVRRLEALGVTLFNLEGTRPSKASGDNWGYSSAGRAPALQAGGRRFDPDYLHHPTKAALLREPLSQYDLRGGSEFRLAPRF